MQLPISELYRMEVQRSDSLLLAWVKYSMRLTGANAIAAAEVAVVLALLTNTGDGPQLLTHDNVFTLLVLSLFAAVAGLWASWKIVRPALAWYVNNQEPTPAQQRTTIQLAQKQTMLHTVIWLSGGALLIAMNVYQGHHQTTMIAIGVLFGATSTSCMGYLITERTMRPLIAVARHIDDSAHPDPLVSWNYNGVQARLMLVWGLCSALPTAAIALIVIGHYSHVVVPDEARIELPVLLLVAISLVVGLRGMLLVSKSVSDPVREVSAAMLAVERGNTDVAVSVYDWSEIGELQSGFNQMVRGLAERTQLRDLLDRHVGAEVAGRAMAQQGVFGGDIRPAAVLFVDLVGSTTVGATTPPDQVAAMLNDFFRIVVTTVDAYGGFVNKFEGDAALAIFGAPEPLPDAAGAALATALELCGRLKHEHPLDFGIGVSFGPVFAGNIGAEARYEYTVIGDPVNEAARLTDLAKSRPGRTLAAGPAVANAADSDRALWRDCGVVTLRGRTKPTELTEPIRAISDEVEQ